MSWRAFQKRQRRREWRAALGEVGPIIVFLLLCLGLIIGALWLDCIIGGRL